MDVRMRLAVKEDIELKAGQIVTICVDANTGLLFFEDLR